MNAAGLSAIDRDRLSLVSVNQIVEQIRTRSEGVPCESRTHANSVAIDHVSGLGSAAIAYDQSHVTVMINTIPIGGAAYYPIVIIIDHVVCGGRADKHNPCVPIP